MRLTKYNFESGYHSSIPPPLDFLSRREIVRVPKSIFDSEKLHPTNHNFPLIYRFKVVLLFGSEMYTE